MLSRLGLLKNTNQNAKNISTLSRDATTFKRTFTDHYRAYIRVRGLNSAGPGTYPNNLFPTLQNKEVYIP